MDERRRKRPRRPVTGLEEDGEILPPSILPARTAQRGALGRPGEPPELLRAARHGRNRRRTAAARGTRVRVTGRFLGREQEREE